VAGPNGALSTVQYGPGTLTIYGCVRQGSQVACDTDFNNQNPNNTFVQNNWWRDAYLVDQFGDRHARATAYFVNGAGQPRDSIDIPYGQSARYIWIFNDVPGNAATASLHSPYGPIDVENMLLDADAQNASGSAGGNGGGQASSGNGSGNAAGNAGSSAVNSAVGQATDAQNKAVKKANDAIQNQLNKIPH
jgi:hypothetical protein